LITKNQENSAQQTHGPTQMILEVYSNIPY